MRCLKMCLPALILGSVTVAYAQEDRGATLIAGGGIGANFEPYLALEDSATLVPVPVLAYQGKRFSFSGKSLSVRAAQFGKVEFSGLLDYRFQGYDADDSPALAGMDDRDGTLEAGVRADLDLGGQVDLSAQVMFDVLGNHGGYEVRGTASYTIGEGPATRVTPFVGVVLRSEDLANYYYGVDADEASIITDPALGAAPFNRFAYAPGETLSPVIGVSVRQALSPKWLVFGNASHEFLPAEVTDSPIVDSDSRTSVGIALARVF